MSIRLHSDQRLVLVLRRQDHFVFTHLLAGVGEADDGYLPADTEPARRPFIPASVRPQLQQDSSQQPQTEPSSGPCA